MHHAEPVMDNISTVSEALSGEKHCFLFSGYLNVSCIHTD